MVNGGIVGAGPRAGLLDIVRNEISHAERDRIGKASSTPALLSSDSDGAFAWACNVEIEGREGIEGNGAAELLYAVPIAITDTGGINHVTVGSAVLLRRMATTGKFAIVGFSKQMPGSFKRYPANIVTGVVGPVEDATLTTRMLTFDELGTLANPTTGLTGFGDGYGELPMDAYGVFQGGTLIQIGP